MINVEAKAGLRSNIIIQDLDIYCLRDYHLSNATSTTKMQIWETITKKFCTKKSRLKKIKPVNSKFFTLPYFDKAIKPNYQEKKKKY